MKESLEKLEDILNDIFKSIERRLQIEQINLKEFDEYLESSKTIDEIELQQHMLKFREKIVKDKDDSSFWFKDIPSLISLLESSKERIRSYKENLSEIGGKNLPNIDIVNLLRQKILTPETPISKTHKGEEHIGHLTNDGYLELEVSGMKKNYLYERQ